MRMFASALAAVFVVALVACGQGGSSPGASTNAAAAPDALGAAQLAAAYKVIGVESADGGKVMNDCGEAVTPEIHPADVGGAVGRAWLIVVGGGPTTAGCYGNAGNTFWLLKTEGDSFAIILQGAGQLAILPTQHDGVKDLAIGGPGFAFPVFVWDGAKYTHQGTIKDSDMPPPIN